MYWHLYERSVNLCIDIMKDLPVYVLTSYERLLIYVLTSLWSTNLCLDIIMKDQQINEIMKDPPVYVLTWKNPLIYVLTSLRKIC